MSGVRHLLIYAQIDLNLIDGSAIWLASVAELLADAQALHVQVLLMKRIERDVVVRSLLAHRGVTLIDPWDLAGRDPAFGEILDPGSSEPLQPATAADFIERLYWHRRIDLCLVRGQEVAEELAGRPHLAQRLWVYLTNPDRFLDDGAGAELPRLLASYRRVVCQTEEAQAALARKFGQSTVRQMVLLPPLIPDVGPAKPLDLSLETPRLGYAGKFSPAYRMLEMLAAFDEIRRFLPAAEFHVVGDKIHNAPPRAGFSEAVLHRLRHTPGVIWHGGVTREQAQAILSHVHVASSWRDESFDDCLELSTKVLEYAALGIPVLLNPTPLQRRLFGADYPGYVETADEFVQRFRALVTVPDRYRQLSRAVQQVAQRFTYDRTRPVIRALVEADCARADAEAPRRVLFAGHDLRFARELIGHFERQPGYIVAIDSQPGHVPHQTALSQRKLEPADLVFCEWCLGNAVWYSQHKQPHQRLIVRLHRQELTTPFLDEIDWAQVDRVIFIAPGVRDEFLWRYPALADRATVVYNSVDCAWLDQPKLEGAEFNLGLLGAVPRLKGPHRALEILEALKRRDLRYTLCVRSKWPNDLAWMRKNPEETEYYDEFFRAVQQSPFSNSVILEPYEEAMSDWYARIGFVLSTSDLEGSHQAVAEGMAAGSIPVIRRWAGADLLYPERYLFETVEEAVELILRSRTLKRYEHERALCQAYARRHFDRPKVIGHYHRLVEALLLRESVDEGPLAAAALPTHG